MLSEPRLASDPLSSEKIPLQFGIGWGLGSAGVMLLLNTTNSLILKYVVDNLGLAAALAGTLIALTRIADALIDPFVGVWSDRTVSRWGRRLPFLLAGAFACAVTPIVLFVLPLYLDPSWLVPAVLFGLIFYALSYTTFNVPYMAMPVEMTPNRHARTYLFSFRVYGIAIGSLLGGALAPFLVAEFGGDGKAFAMMGLVIAGVILVFCLSCFLLLRGAPSYRLEEAANPPSLSDMRYAFRNKPFARLMLAKLFIVSGTTTAGSAFAFFVVAVMDATLALMGIFALASTTGLFASQPIWLRLSRWKGKRVCFMAAASAYALFTLTWLSSGPNEPEYMFILRAALQGFFGGGVLLASQAMLPDCLEHEYEQTGLRHEAALTGLYTTVERGSSALGVAIAGWMLGWGGYVAGAPTISSYAVAAIYACVAVIPAIFMMISILILWGYKLEG